VEVGVVVGDGFDGVASGVAEVEEGAVAGGFAFVLGDDVGFDLDGAGDDGGEVVWGAVFYGLEELGVGDDGVFDDFGEAGVELAWGEGGEEVEVGKDGRWLVKGADEVFAFWEVDAGFSANGAIDHGEEGGGDLDVADAAEVDGSDEAGEVADDATAKGEDEGLAVETGSGEGGEDVREVVEGFGGFA
jgi:hypothetical protein